MFNFAIIFFLLVAPCKGAIQCCSVFLAAQMEQTVKSEVAFDASPQYDQIYVIFNRSGVFCNTAVSDPMCLCYSNGSLLNGVTGNIKVCQIVSDTWQHTLGTKRGTL